MCDNGDKTAQGKDECGNTCYQCCVDVWLYTRDHTGCYCSANGDGTYTQYRGETWSYPDEPSHSSSTSGGTYNSAEACEAAYNFSFCDGGVTTYTSECH